MPSQGQDVRLRMVVPNSIGPVGDKLRSDVKYYWNFDVLVSGTMILDKTGRGNHLINHGGIIVPGLSGKAILLNGTNQYLDMSSTPDVHVDDSDFSIAVWFNPTSGGVNQYLVSQYGGEYFVEMDNGNQGVGFMAGGDSSYPAVINPENPSIITVNNWHLLVFVHDALGQNMYLYYDNVPSAPSHVEPGQASTSDGLIIGADNIPSSPNSFFSGYINSIGKWDRILTQSEMNFLWLNPNGQNLYL